MSLDSCRSAYTGAEEGSTPSFRRKHELEEACDGVYSGGCFIGLDADPLMNRQGSTRR